MTGLSGANAQASLCLHARMQGKRKKIRIPQLTRLKTLDSHRWTSNKTNQSEPVQEESFESHLTLTITTLSS